jgi:hypothetical protein
MTDRNNMNSKYLTVVAALAVMLVSATILATTNSAFARDGNDQKHKSYGKNPDVTSVNDCGNGDAPMNIQCKNRALQLPIDDNNKVTFESNQGFSESPSPLPSPSPSSSSVPNP